MLIGVRKMLLHISFIFTYLISSITIVQPNFIAYYCDDNKGNYTISSTYRKILLEKALYMLPSNGNDNGFYRSNANVGDETIYSVALCRGDVDTDLCGTCVNESVSMLPQLCPNQKYAIGYGEYCMLKYSNLTDILRNNPANFFMYIHKSPNASDPERYYSGVTTLINMLIRVASSGGELRKFASGNITSPDVPTIFALVQCTPDLSKKQCGDCLKFAIGVYTNKKYGGVRGTIYLPTCNLRYDTHKFFNGSTLVIPTPPISQPSLPNPPPPGKSIRIRTRTMIVIVVVLLSSIILAASIGFIVGMRRNRNPRPTQDEDESEDIGTPKSLRYNFSVVRAATNGFSEDNKLGEGGFGAVYKGVLGDERQIAVKRLGRTSTQGDVEFRNEVSILANLHHRNLVKLLGLSIEGTERLLIYEFLPRGSLDHFIFDEAKRADLDWQMRYNIILGIAKGLQYLHGDSGQTIVHRDMKPSNVLLDADLNPKIADFGMARLFEPDQTQAETRHVVGTYGYMAPECALHCRFSVKSDIYSFGVMVLEIITGEKNRYNEESGEYFLATVWKRWQQDGGAAANIIDPMMNAGAGSLPDIMRSIQMGLLCVQQNVDHRPPMASIVSMLNSSSVTMALPSQPIFSNSTTNQEASTSGFQPTFFNSTTNQEASTSGSQSIYTDRSLTYNR